ncbi:MAG: MerR family transcriptional regulator [Pseudonocardiaceae bacterium]
MPVFRIGEAARLLGVSDDTLRRWADAERFASTTTESGRRGVDEAELARVATALAADAEQAVPQPPPYDIERAPWMRRWGQCIRCYGVQTTVSHALSDNNWITLRRCGILH